MLTKLYAFISLQAFTISTARKLLWLLSVVVLGAIIYLNHIGWLKQYLHSGYIQILIVFFSSYTILTFIRFALISTYRQRIKVPNDERDNFIIGMDSIVWLIVLLVTVGSIFPILSIPFLSFLTSLSLFSVAFAWLFKEYLTNFIDSYRLMFSKDFLIGDYIKLGEQSKGVITDITFRATKIKTDSGDVLFVPNTTLMNTEVVNYSKVKFKRIIVPFTIAAESVRDFNAFEASLTQALVEAFPDLVKKENIFLRVISVDVHQTQCALEASVDRYSFDIESDLTKTVYKLVLAVQPKVD